MGLDLGAPATYAIGGTVSGLSPGGSLTLTDAGSDSLTVSANGGGVVSDSAVNSIAITCVDRRRNAHAGGKRKRSESGGAIQ